VGVDKLNWDGIDPEENIFAYGSTIGGLVGKGGELKAESGCEGGGGGGSAKEDCLTGGVDDAGAGDDDEPLRMFMEENAESILDTEVRGEGGRRGGGGAEGAT